MWSSIICFQFNESTTTHDSISKPMITQQTKSNLQKVHSNFCYYIHIVSMRCQTTFGQIIMYNKLVLYNKICHILLSVSIFTLVLVQMYILYTLFCSKFFHFFPISNHFSVRDYFRLLRIKSNTTKISLIFNDKINYFPAKFCKDRCLSF